MAGSTDHFPETPHQRLRFARLKAGMTQKQLAEAMHRSLSTLKEWERDDGSYPKTLTCVEKLCDLLDISLDWYVRGKGTMRPQKESRFQREMAIVFERLTEEEKSLLLSVAKRMKGK